MLAIVYLTVRFVLAARQSEARRGGGPRAIG